MSKLLYNEMHSLFCGRFLGQGISRKVYVLRGFEDYVVKIEEAGRSFQNIAEWETWGWVKQTRMERWFAPCMEISNAGIILIQRRVQPIRPDERPPRLPAFLCDLKRENFGILDGRLVCCDYGMVLSAIRNTDKSMSKAKWRD